MDAVKEAAKREIDNMKAEIAGGGFLREGAIMRRLIGKAFNLDQFVERIGNVRFNILKLDPITAAPAESPSEWTDFKFQFESPGDRFRMILNWGMLITSAGDPDPTDRIPALVLDQLYRDGIFVLDRNTGKGDENSVAAYTLGVTALDASAADVGGVPTNFEDAQQQIPTLTRLLPLGAFHERNPYDALNPNDTSRVRFTGLNGDVVAEAYEGGVQMTPIVAVKDFIADGQ